MKIACTGYNGKVGKLLTERYGVFPLVCDVTKSIEVEKAINDVKPDLIVHLASISNVDYCEDKKNWNDVISVNFNGTLHVLDVALRHKIGIAFLSTDHIFDGKQGNYKEDYKFIGGWGPFRAYHRPTNSYGLSKLAAETLRRTHSNMKIVRTSYIFDAKRVSSIPMISTYPTFMYRSFMHMDHFVESLSTYLTRFLEMPKIVHISGNKIVSWYQFAVDRGLHNISPRDKEISNQTPRPYKAGLDVGLSAQLELPQYSYLDGIKLLNVGK